MLYLPILGLLAGSPAAGGEPPGPRVIISEVHYHPSPAQGRAEFVEVKNAGSAAADLSGWRLTRGVEFTFPDGWKLAPGELAVVCEDLAAFRRAFGEGTRIAGTFRGKLDSAGELVRLEDPSGKAASDLRYLDVPPWPLEADGRGASLQRLSAERDADDPSNWEGAGPTPGAASAARAAADSPSLYQPRHAPRVPAPGEPVKLSVSVHGAGPGARVTLRYQTGRGEKSAAMRAEAPAPLAAWEDPVYRAEIAAPPAGSLVRYWFETEGPRGRVVRCPPREAPTPNLAFQVAEAEVATKLPLYRLLIEPGALQALQRNPRSNQLQPAVFIAQGEVFDGVKLRCRGAWARTWPKKAWKIVFPRDHPFGKHRRLNLNSAWHDPAFIREPLAYEVYREAGCLSLESKMVRLHLNGAFWGIFCEVEQPKQGYLARHGLRGAVLYKAASRSNVADERVLGSAEEYGAHYTLETSPGAGHEPLAAFCRGLAEADDPKGFLETHLDVSRYLDHIAAGALLQNWDAYNKNHFLVFDGRGSRKWQVIPWDVDRTLGDHWDWAFDVATHSLLQGTERHPGTTGWNRLLDRFLGVPEFRRRFEERVRELLASGFTEERLWPRIDALADSIAAEADLDRRRWGGNADWRGAIEELKRYVAARRAFLLSQLPGGEPRAPRNLKPAPGAALEGGAVVLQSSPFAHDDPRVLHRASRFQVRAESGSYGAPAVDHTMEERGTSFAVPRGMLFPNTAYRWRVAHRGSNGKLSAFSEETSFTTGDFALKVVRFDLSAHLNRDVVANAGDRADDSLDWMGSLLIEDGFDGARAGIPEVNGLPRDRRVGIHLLADYSGANALQLSAGERARVRIEVVPARYAFVRFLVTGGGGDSRVPVVIEYLDGARGEAVLPCDDWYDDDPPDGPAGSLQPGVVPVLNGMDRLKSRRFKDRNDPALFEVSLPADPARVLTAVVIDGSRAAFDPPARAAFNLFAAAGIVLGEP